MPVRQTTHNGKPAYQWGTTGKKYTFDPTDRKDRQRAREAAIEQGRAIEASKGRRY